MKVFIFFIVCLFAVETLYSEQEPDPKLVQKLTSLMDRGIKLQMADKHAEAVKVFDEAYKLFPHPKVLYFKANSLVKLKRYQEALRIYEKIKDSEKVKKYYGIIKNAIDFCKKMLKKTEVVINTGNLSGILVTIDGKKVGTAPVSIKLTRGEHQLLLSKDGFYPLKKKIVCKGEDKLVLDYTLEKKSKISKKEKVTSATKAESKFTISKKVSKKGALMPWIALSGGVTLFVAGGVFTGVYFYDLSRAEGEKIDPAKKLYKPADTVSKTNLYVGSGLMICGIALSVYSYFLFQKADRKKSNSKSITLFYTGSIAGITGNF